jgi:superfamily II DNA or RNA helicase
MQRQMRLVPKDPPLEDKLVLARFLASKIGLDGTDLTVFNDVQEGFDSTGRSFMYHRILSQSGLQLSEAQLREYDENIRKHTEKMKRNRGENLSLRYFQYLGLLFTEYYLDRFFKDEMEIVNEIELFCQKIETNEAFSTGDLRKIAFWMATGSGKTLVMHINYWQFLHYAKKYRKQDRFENILLITPSEKMTEQHMKEFEKSGIRAKNFVLSGSSAFDTSGDPVVKVIEIHKLKLPEDKKGEGLSVSVGRFGEKNIIFVDEGHKGNKSEDQKWKRVREAIGADGFTFEYSATFGQSIEPKDKDAMSEYSKAIILDYSYRFFHRDGFGKDFQVINMKDTAFTKTQERNLLLANAIAYYEQLLVFADLSHAEKRDYEFEQPLWVFVGSKVNKNDEASEEMQSDILKVVDFLNWFLTENREKMEQDIESLLHGKSGIVDNGNQDVFRPQEPEVNFSRLRRDKISAAAIYKGIFSMVFQARPDATGRTLHLVPIKSAEGEIGIKAGASSYFGLIDIGNRSNFLEIVRQKAKSVVVEAADSMSPSLFDNLDDNQNLKVLIGAKKFIEGWDCHRVSTMGLLDIGKGEGSQIIQLFGRGVRLRGKNNSMKRSDFTAPPHPKDIAILENLRIFGIDADYMKKFREIIDRENVREFVELKPPLDTNLIVPFPDGLFVIRPKGGASFKDEIVNLEPKKALADVDILPRAEDFFSREKGIVSTTDTGFSNHILDEILELVDWDALYLEMLELKAEKGWHNLLIDKKNIRKIIDDKLYNLSCQKKQVTPNSFENMSDSVGGITGIVRAILTDYLTRYYSRGRCRWEKDKDNLVLANLKEEDDGLLRNYRILIAKDKPELIENVAKLIKSGDIYQKTRSQGLLLNAYLENHLYQPLLVNQEGELLKTQPVGLNKGETKFINDLATWLGTKPTSVKDSEIFVLRNLTKGRGIGFFEENSFYPDFIMWIKEKSGQQKVIFIDPKGIIFTGLKSEKLNLHRHLKDEITPHFRKMHPNLTFDSFILSTTAYDAAMARYGKPTTTKNIGKYGEENHLLFQYVHDGIENPGYVSDMFELIRK